MPTWFLRVITGTASWTTLDQRLRRDTQPADLAEHAKAPNGRSVRGFRCCYSVTEITRLLQQGLSVQVPDLVLNIRVKPADKVPAEFHQ